MVLARYLTNQSWSHFALQKMGQPVLDRYMESEIRPKAFEELGRQIQVYMKFIEAYKTKVTGNGATKDLFQMY